MNESTKARDLCAVCGGNGVVKIPGGVSTCDHCHGDCWEPAGALGGVPPPEPLELARRLNEQLDGCILYGPGNSVRELAKRLVLTLEQLAAPSRVGRPEPDPANQPDTHGPDRQASQDVTAANEPDNMWSKRLLVEAHQALDRYGVATTREMPRRAGEGKQSVTLSVAERVAILAASRRVARGGASAEQE